MALYSIGTLLVEIDTFSHSYLPFLLQEKQEAANINLTISHTAKPHDTKQLLKAAQLSFVTIWKDKTDPEHVRWVFEALGGLCTISVNADYSEAEYYYSNVFEYLHTDGFSDFLNPYFQLLLECKLIQNNFTILHSAAVKTGNHAYAFTGPSGIGKSSRARKWIDLFSGEWISGDRPALDVNKGYIYGVPWDGKEAVFRNVRWPLTGIFSIRRSENTEIKEMSVKEKFQTLCEQSLIPLWDTRLAARSMHSLKYLLDQVPMFELYCDITDESIHKANEMIEKALS